MRRERSARVPFVVALALVTALSACGVEGDRLLIEIIHPSSSGDPSLWSGELQVAVFDVETEDVIASGDVATSALGEPSRVLDALELTEGRRYVVALNALLAGETCKPSNRAVGLSPPFVYEGDPPTLSIHVDCADRTSAVALLEQARLYHTATLLPSPAPHGRVVVTGGLSLKSLADLADLTKATVHDSIEVFDPGTNSFSRLGARLSRPRAFHQATALGEDALVLTGGLDSVSVGGINRLDALDLVERLRGDRHELLEPLATKRAFHAALPVAGDRLLVAGGTTTAYVPLKKAELYDPVVGQRAGAVPEAKSVHVQPGAVAVGGLVLLLGGAWWPNIALPEDAFCLDGSCGGCAGPCFTDLPGFPKGQGRSNLGVVHVPCGDGPGAVYAVGGRHDAYDKGAVPAEVFDDIYCVELERLDRGLRRVGGLLAPRYTHSVSLVRGPDDSRRLFVAGGTGADGDLLKDAELVPVGCRCENVDSGQIETVPLTSERAGHTATVLVDGSVLLVGGIVGSNTAERFTPTF